MKKGKRVKPVIPIEYSLLIVPKYKERENKNVILFALRTVNEFTNFRYEIVAESSIIDRTINIIIRGLRAPQVTLPGLGPAIYKTEFENLHGLYDVIISKHEKEKNKFTVHITDKKVEIEKKQRKVFSEIVTDENDW